MRTRRILVVAAVVLGAGLVGAGPAWAGGWAETVLDPTPASIEPGVTYTFGFWVLQHGSYPIRFGELGPVALTATDADGTLVRFPATESATDAHYSAEVVFPHESTWELGVEHGALARDEDIALVTVPGPVRVSPSDVRHRAPHDWGTVRPSFPPPADDAAVVAPRPEVTALVEPRAQDTASTAEGDGPAVELWVAGGLTVLAAALWLGRRATRRTG